MLLSRNSQETVWEQIDMASKCQQDCMEVFDIGHFVPDIKATVLGYARMKNWNGNEILHITEQCICFI